MRIGTLDGVLVGKKGPIPWSTLYQTARDLGFEGLELGVGPTYDSSELWSPEGRKALKGVSASTGVLTPSICIHSYWNYSFASPDPEVRARARRIAEEAALAAAEMGAKNILVPFTCPTGVDDNTARARWIEGVKAAAPAAVSNGVVFCLENVGKTFANAPKDIVSVVDAIGSPAVQVYYDPGNAVHNDMDPLEGIRTLGKRIRHVHVKEVKGTYIGEGIVPWPLIIAELRKVGYDGWLILETASTDDPNTAAAKNLKTLKSLI